MGDSHNENAPIVSLQGIGKTFALGINRAAAEYVLDDVALELGRGDSLSILGPSGSGKSTLLNIIGGLDQPTEGSYTFEGRPVAEFNASDLVEMRRSKVGLVFQFHHLLSHCTVLENVLVPTLAFPRRAHPRDASARAVELLERVGLSHRIDHRPGELSGGEKQRVAVVRALINRPVLLLADEPTGSLDRDHAQNLFDLLLEINREDGVTLIVVTHDESLAVQLGAVMRIERGRLIPHSAAKAGTDA